MSNGKVLLSFIIISFLASFTSAQFSSYDVDGNIIIDFNGSIYENYLDGNLIYNDNPYLNISSMYRCSFGSPCYQNITDLRGVSDSYFGAVTGDGVCGYRLEVWRNVSHKGEPIYEEYVNSMDCHGEQGVNYGLLNGTVNGGWMWCNDSICAEIMGGEWCYSEHYFNSFISNDSGVRIYFNDTRIVDYEDDYYYSWEQVNSISYADRFGKTWAYAGFNLDAGEILQLRHYFYPCDMQIGHIEAKFYELFWRDLTSSPWQDLLSSKDNNWVALLDPWADSDYAKCKNITLPALGCTGERVLMNLTGISTPQNITIYNASCSDGGSVVAHTRNRNGSDWTEEAIIRSNDNTAYSVYYEPTYAADTSDDTVLFFYDDFSVCPDGEPDWSYWNITDTAKVSCDNDTVSLSSIDSGEYNTDTFYSKINMSNDFYVDVSYYDDTTNGNYARYLAFVLDYGTWGNYLNLMESLSDKYRYVANSVAYDYTSSDTIHMGVWIRPSARVEFSSDDWNITVFASDSSIISTDSDISLDSGYNNFFAGFFMNSDSTGNDLLDNFSIWNVSAGACEISRTVTLGAEELITTTTTTTTTTTIDDTVTTIDGSIGIYEGDDAADYENADNDIQNAVSLLGLFQEEMFSLFGDLIAIAVLIFVAFFVAGLFSMFKVH